MVDPDWRYPADGPITQQRTANLAVQSGYAISSFAYTETMLLMVFAAAARLPPDVAAQVLGPLRNFSTVMDVVDPLVRHRLAGSALMPFWVSLVEYIRELSGDRNYLAHTPIAAHIIGDVKDPKDGDLEPKIGPAMASFLTKDMRRQPIDTKEATALHLDFRHAGEQLGKFLQCFQSDGTVLSSLPAELTKPVVRRRPPRAIRLATSPPRQPRRPPSSRPLRDKKKERGEK